ncbi:MAG: hypothetical protein AB7O44_26055 [Hyphomicrobiaceae bacterium]
MVAADASLQHLDRRRFAMELTLVLALPKTRLPWRKPLRSMIRIAFAWAALVCAGPALAQYYPDKPVRIIVGFAAGGPTDVIARIVADKLSASLGRQF